VDRRRRRSSWRSVLAGRFAILYFACATAALAFAVKLGGRGLLLPLIFAAPIVLIQLGCDSLGRSRALVAELAGSVATGAVAAAIAVADNWPLRASYGLWLVMAARAVPTILYLRARLRLLHHKPASQGEAIIAHVLAILALTGLAWASVVPFLAVAALVVLLLRAVIGFAREARELTPKKLGITEIGFGALTVISTAIGYRFGW
jgi:hypothetical protein